jgi:uncharacterized protein
MGRPVWWKDGIRFECQQSGKCCVSRGSYGFVYLTAADRKRLAQSLSLTVREFTKLHCEKTDGFTHLKEIPEQQNCKFFKGGGCSVYEARPTQCRTWPFWPENMSAKAWSLEVASFCPGVGRGPVRAAESIAKQIQIQKRSEESL